MTGLAGVIDGSGNAAEQVARRLHCLQHRGYGGGQITFWGTNAALNHEEDGWAPGFSAKIFSGTLLEGLNPVLDATLTHKKTPGCASGETERLNTEMCVGIVSGRHYADKKALCKLPLGVVGAVMGGYVSNMDSLREEVYRRRSHMCNVNSQAELVAALMNEECERSVLDSLASALARLEGRFSLLLMTEEGVFAARDPQGTDPLSFCAGDGGHPAAVFASESCALPRGNFEDVGPGTITYAGRDGARRSLRFAEGAEKRCLHELVWRSKPNSTVYGEPVSCFRARVGEKLAELYADGFSGFHVVSVPDSAVNIGEGFSGKSGLPQNRALLRDHFIRYGDRRDCDPGKIEVDGNIVPENVVLVEDSVNEGKTIHDVVGMLRQAGAKRVYLLSATPPRVRCRRGRPPKAPLLAERYDSDEAVAGWLGVDGLHYLRPEHMHSCLKEPGRYCMDCYRRHR